MRKKREPYRRSYLFERHDGFQYKRAVPKAFQEVLAPRKVFVRWIGKVGKAEAERKARLFAVEHDALFARLAALSPSERADFIASGGELEAAAKFDEYMAAVAWSYHPFGDGTGAPSLVAAERKRKLAAKLSGDDSETLTGLVDLWKRIKAPRNPATEDSTRRALRRFIAICGDLDPRDVTSDHARTYRDKLDKDGHSRVTIKKSLERLSSVFATAVSEGKIATNPFYKITPIGNAGKVSGGRMSFSRDQLRLILSRCGELNSDDSMVIRLLIHHGSRPSEICQLRCVDVLEVDGVPALRITDEGEGASLKTKESFRTIPIHSACIQEVLARAEARRAAGKSMLFDYPFVPSKGTRSHRFSERLSRWIRNGLKITDKRFVTYSARHSFIDVCRAAAMPQYIINQIVGQRLAKGHAGGYGIGVSVPELAKWLERIAY